MPETAVDKDHGPVFRQHDVSRKIGLSSMDRGKTISYDGAMKIAVVLEDHEWGQILDGLRCRAELYDETVQYYKAGYAESEIAEVKDEEEARDLAMLYWGIIAKIKKGLAGRSTD
jgi:hypothetical protein